MIAIRSSFAWLTRCALIALSLTAVSVSAQTSGNLVTGSFSGLVFNRATNTFNSILTLTNNGSALPAPLTICISTGAASVSVKGATSLGADSFAVPVTLPGRSLSNGQTVQMVVAFVNPGRVSFIPTVTSPPPVQPQYDPTSSVTASIDSAGGSLSVAIPVGLATLTVPPNGLSDATRITMTPITGFTGRTPSGWRAGVQLEPSGLQFLQPVTLTFQLPSSPASGPTVAYVFKDDGTQMYEDMAAANGSTATVDLTHFTGAGVAASSCSAPIPIDPTWTPEQEARSEINYAVGCLENSPDFDAVVEGALAYWFNSGILPDIQSANTVSSWVAVANRFTRWEKVFETVGFDSDPVISALDGDGQSVAASVLLKIEDALLQNCNCSQLTANPITEAQTDASLNAIQRVIDTLGWPELDPLLLTTQSTNSCQVLTLRDSLNVATGVASVTFVPLALLTPAVTLQVGQSIPVSSVFNNSEPQIPPNASVQWTSADSAVATTDSTSINAVGPGTTALTVNASQCGNAPVSTPSPLQVSVCGLNGTWSGPYSGDTVNHKGDQKSFSGIASMAFTQNGSSVRGNLVGVDFPGIDDKGSVTLGPVDLPCHNGTEVCPAEIDAKLSPDCSTLVGYFYFFRPRTILGTFTFTAPSH